MSKKIKKIMNKPSLIKEWNDTSFKDLPKRWSGAYGRKDGLTEFEAAGGQDNIKLGKLYTDKDRPPFATNKQIEDLKLKEEYQIDDKGWLAVKGVVKGFFAQLKNISNAIGKKDITGLYGYLDDLDANQLKAKDVVKKYLKTDEVKEGLTRWKVFIQGESKPLILTGKNEKDVKQIAHAMIRNSSVKISKVVRD